MSTNKYRPGSTNNYQQISLTRNYQSQIGRNHQLQSSAHIGEKIFMSTGNVRTSALMANRELHERLQKQASSYGEKDHFTKTIFVSTSTTKPPIVWFPGDPDCGEGDLGGNVQMDTFQLVAFLMSVFNIASLMVSNVNNNNNNNNINDNEANVNDNNINESNTNAMVNSMVMVGLGGRSFGTRTEAEEGLENTIWNLLQVVMTAYLAPSTGCLESLLCEAGAGGASQGGISLLVTEAASLLLAKLLPGLGAPHSQTRRRVLAGGQAGRAGLPCNSLYTECEPAEQNFMAMANMFTSSSAAPLRSLEKLISWAVNK